MSAPQSPANVTVATKSPARIGANWTATIRAVTRQPNWPAIDHPTPWLFLAPHLGHKVEITGVAVPGKDKTHTMKVTAVKMISSKCP